jgi:glycosyltransferase involved in cell wall biosynthesis
VIDAKRPMTMRAASTVARRVAIVVPVRQDVAAARRCIASVLASHNETTFVVTVVAAGDIGGELSATCSELLRDGRCELLRVPRELDYAQTVDRALARQPELDAVLLQNDTQVHGDWLDRLVRHAEALDTGFVGTFTNVAGIATYPRAGERNALPAGLAAAELDAVFAAANAGRSAEVQAAFGPCLLVTRACRAAAGSPRAVGGADGHGCELDWTLRASASGFRTRIAGDVFVANDGEGSFGGRALACDAHAPDATLAGLHGPDAEGLRGRVARQLLPLARRVDVARLARSARPVIVFVAHAWGGGVRRHMQELTAAVGERAEVLYLEPAHGDAVALSWPRAGEAFATWFRLPEDMALLAHTLRAIGTTRLHYHHVHGLPRAILDLPRESGIAYDCTLHDYFAICPQYHLVDEHGRYCGEPDAAGCARCLERRPAQWPLDIGAWRETFGDFLRHAERVIAPSNDAASRMARYFPGLAIDVWPHAEGELARPERLVRVVTLGNLAPEKGLRVVEACAADARARALPLAFRVLGATSEPVKQMPDAPLTVLGSYAEASLPQLLASERADVLLFPAQVPETYAYTLSVALGTSTPIVASAIGAFPERLAGRPRVRLLPFDAPPAHWNDALLALANEARALGGPATARIGVPARAES